MEEACLSCRVACVTYGPWQALSPPTNYQHQQNKIRELYTCCPRKMMKIIAYICGEHKMKVMMKKIVTTILLALMTVIAVAQSSYDARLKFLGIPIDGTKTEMKSQLIAKGFKQDPNYENVVHGEFNGRESNIHIVVNREKVYRILVADANTVSESQIKIRFNELIRQFENSNAKYLSLIPNKPIPDDEDISYEMTVHDKHYEASFYYNPIFDDAEAMRQLLEETTAECKEVLEERKDEKVLTGEDITYGEMLSDESAFREYLSMTLGMKVLSLSNSQVWFTINEFAGKYYISLYYDNLDNQANGEDL